MKRFISLLILSIATSTIASAQIAVGSWRTHFSYNSTTQVVQTPNKVFGVADKRLFSISKTDETIDTYTKIDGFSGNGVERIAYNKEKSLLVIVYTTSDIDILDADGNIYNIPDLYKKSLAVDKTVYQIYFKGNYAYLSCGFGVVVLNTKNMEISDTYIIGDDAAMKPVYGFASDDTYFYALMDDKIKRAKVSGVNLLDYNNWEEGQILLPDESAAFRNLYYYSNCIVVSKTKASAYKYDGQSWQVFYDNSEQKRINISISDDNLFVCNESSFHIYSNSWTKESIENINAEDIASDGSVYWIAGSHRGIIRMEPNKDYKFYKPDGPYISSAQSMTYSKGRMLFAPGYSWMDRGNVEGAVLIFDNNVWTSYTGTSTDAASISPNGIFKDIVSVAVDPDNDNHIFATTYGEGVYEFLDGKAVKLFNNENSVLEDIGGFGVHYVRVDGLTYDAKKNLWLVNSGAEYALKYMTPDGIWHSAPKYASISGQSTLQQIVINSKKQKWVRAARSASGVFVLDDGSTIDEVSDDKSRFFTSFTDKDGNILKPQYIYSMEEDRSGTMWLGTSNGPILMNSVNKVFDSNYTCSRIKIPRNDGTNLADYLLDGVNVRAIAVDGADRKWLGTDNSGLYLVSSDGTKTIHHFTTENSPLSSNNINSIKLNEETGEVFISTVDGIVSYRSDSTEPVDIAETSKVHVFPNPVRPNYTGLITITGLEENSLVKITDASGNLVYEGTSTGGSISWTGKNYSGSYVSGGIYFVHCFNSSQEENRSVAAKILIVR